MRKTLAETFAWNTLAPAINDWMRKSYPAWETELILEHAKGGFKRMVQTSDNIGSRTYNPYRLYLDAAMILIAFYKASNMKESEFKEMCQAAINAPIVQMTLASNANIPFSDAQQSARAALAQQVSKCSASEMNWHAQVIPGASAESYRVEFSACGVYALAQRERVTKIAKHLCMFEETIVAMAGGYATKYKCMLNGDSNCVLLVDKKKK